MKLSKSDLLRLIPGLEGPLASVRNRQKIILEIYLDAPVKMDAPFSESVNQWVITGQLVPQSLTWRQLPNNFHSQPAGQKIHKEICEAPKINEFVAVLSISQSHGFKQLKLYANSRNKDFFNGALKLALRR